ATRRFEIEDADDLARFEQQVVVEEIAVDDTLRKLSLQVVVEVLDFFVERARDLLEVAREFFPNVAIELEDALEAEPVVDAFLVSLTDEVKRGELASDVLELVHRELARIESITFDMSIERNAFAAELPIVPSLAIRQRLRARERMFAKEHEKIDLALHFELALHLVDLEEELPPRGVEQVVSVDRAARYAVAQQELAEPVVLYDLRELFTI